VNEIEKRQNTLPDKIEDLAEFYRKSSARCDMLMAGIERYRGMKDISKDKLDEITNVVREAQEEKLDAEVKLGDYFLSVAKASGRRTDLEPEVNGKPRSKKEVAESLGFDENARKRFQTLAAHRDVVEAVKAEARQADDIPTRSAVLKAVKEKEKEQRIDNEQKQRKQKVSDIEIRSGDFAQVLEDVYDIDAIITDPPYPAEYLDEFSKLAVFAENHLKKDGFLVCYSGQYNLPEVIRRLSEHLTYVWCFCLYHSGKKQLVNGVNIMCGWKPVLIFSNGRKKMRYSAYDVTVSEQMEKASHKWQQSESGVAQLVDIFSEPGQLVCDPFAGSGTFLKVAHDNGRKTIGAEIDA
jgi:site-specific DNA-methyltransferase (adenine-specific)